MRTIRAFKVSELQPDEYYTMAELVACSEGLLSNSSLRSLIQRRVIPSSRGIGARKLYVRGADFLAWWAAKP